MPSREDRAAAFQQARTDLRALLAASNTTQSDLAVIIGLSQSNLSKRLSRDSVAIFEAIADSFPPASWVTARLYARLAQVYLSAWEALAQGPEEDLRRAITAMEKVIQEARKR